HRKLGANSRLVFDECETLPRIPKTEVNAVLQLFHRAERSRHTPGSGLGLSLVAAVARLHGLHLVIDDAGPGCRVRLWRDPTAGRPPRLELAGSAPRIDRALETADAQPPARQALSSGCEPGLERPRTR